MTKPILFAVLFFACVSTRVAAQDRIQDTRHPTIEWTKETRTALAQCLVAEAGWRHRTEHAAIVHVLERRWHRAYRRNRRVTFEDTIRRYCAVHRRADVRRPWLKELDWAPMTEDPGFEATVTWTNYVDAWEYVRTTVELFEKDALPDPMPLARHWGGRMDGVPVGGVLLARTAHSTGSAQGAVDGRCLSATGDGYELRLARRVSTYKASRGRYPRIVLSRLSVERLQLPWIHIHRVASQFVSAVPKVLDPTLTNEKVAAGRCRVVLGIDDA